MMGLKVICTLHSAGKVNENTPCLEDKCSDKTAHLLPKSLCIPFPTVAKGFFSIEALLCDCYRDHLNHWAAFILKKKKKSKAS